LSFASFRYDLASRKLTNSNIINAGKLIAGLPEMKGMGATFTKGVIKMIMPQVNPTSQITNENRIAFPNLYGILSS
jgi:hypothetical protein